MVAKTFLVPFAANGDRTPAIPNAQQSDGSVSYTTGYGPDYEKQLGVDPGAKNISREAFNSALNDITVALQEVQSGLGLPPFSTTFAAALPGGGYPRGAIVPRADAAGYWLNQNAGVTTADPTTAGSGWVPLSVSGTFTQALTNTNVTLSPTNGAFRTIVLTGALTANIILTLPTWSGYNWVVDNRCTGAFTVSLKTATQSTPVVIPASVVSSVFCDGTDIKLHILQATETLFGGSTVATQANLNAGTDDAKIVTAKKLRFGFVSAFGNNGYIVFPQWLGGFIIQWIRTTTLGSQGASSTFPIPFPNACFGVWATCTNGSSPQTVAISGTSINTTGFSAWAGAVPSTFGVIAFGN